MEPLLGNDWLRDSSLPGGIFDNPKTLGTQKIIFKAYNGLNANGTYTPTKLMAEMEFGIWKYMFSGPQYAATGQKLLSVFPAKPKSTPALQIDNKYGWELMAPDCCMALITFHQSVIRFINSDAREGAEVGTPLLIQIFFFILFLCGIAARHCGQRVRR